jgi:hypothetical protein
VGTGVFVGGKGVFVGVDVLVGVGVLVKVGAWVGIGVFVIVGVRLGVKVGVGSTLETILPIPLIPKQLQINSKTMMTGIKKAGSFTRRSLPKGIETGSVTCIPHFAEWVTR